MAIAFEHIGLAELMRERADKELVEFSKANHCQTEATVNFQQHPVLGSNQIGMRST